MKLHAQWLAAGIVLLFAVSVQAQTTNNPAARAENAVQIKKLPYVAPPPPPPPTEEIELMPIQAPKAKPVKKTPVAAPKPAVKAPAPKAGATPPKKAPLSPASVEAKPKAGNRSAKLQPLEPIASGALTLSPGEAALNTDTATAVFRVLMDGKPVDSQAVTSAQLTTQAFMFVVTKSERGAATITVTPVPERYEAGSYTLAVTAQGETAYANIAVDFPKPMVGVSEMMVQPELGLDTSYREGTVLNLRIQGPAGATFVWAMNGQEIARGVDKDALSFCFSEPGPCVLAVSLLKDGRQVGRTAGKTRVEPIKPIAWTVTAGNDLVLEDVLPGEYQEFEWQVDGKKISAERNFKHVISTPGRVRIDGFAREPITTENPRKSVHIAYDTVVAPRK